MSDASRELLCPRCGYDISGTVPTWTDSCPLEGTCSECGLTYLWVDIFRPERLYPAWSFEHVKTRRVRAWFKTVFVALRPRKLWGELPMAAPIRVWRLAIMVLLLAIGTHVVAAGAACHLHWSDLRVMMATGPAAWTMVSGGRRVFLPPPVVMTFDWQEFGRMVMLPYWREANYRHWLIGPLGLVALLWGALAPLPYLVLVDTMKRAKCRPAHLVRGWAYFVPTLAALLIGDLGVLELLSGTSGWLGVLVIVVRPAATIALCGIVIAWIVLWWSRFTTTYLRLEQARLVTTLMLAMSLLAAVTIGLFLDREVFDLAGTFANFFLG